MFICIIKSISEKILQQQKEKVVLTKEIPKSIPADDCKLFYPYKQPVTITYVALPVKKGALLLVLPDTKSINNSK